MFPSPGIFSRLWKNENQFTLQDSTVHTVPMNGHLKLLSIQEFYTVYSVTNDTEDKIILQWESSHYIKQVCHNYCLKVLTLRLYVVVFISVFCFRKRQSIAKGTFMSLTNFCHFFNLASSFSVLPSWKSAIDKATWMLLRCLQESESW